MAQIIATIAATANTLTWPAAFAIVGVSACAAAVAIVFIVAIWRG